MRRILACAAAILLFLGWTLAAEGEVLIPEIKVPAKDIPDNEAMKTVREMKAGWNLGNTFDAYDCFWLTDPLDYETGWCGVRTEERLIQALQDAGFRTLRIPVSWHNHLDAEGRIDEKWLARVKEVASWAYERGMYVILNIHHDCDPAYYYPDSAHRESSEKYIRSIWTQLAREFADWDGRLIFVSINEPRLTKSPAHEWVWDGSSAECRDAMAVIVALNQVFVDTVRAEGGQNETRYLMVPAYDASPYYACEESFTLPEDRAENRIIVSVHAYTPYDFALQQMKDGGTDRYSLNSTRQKSEIATFLNRLYDRFVSRGIPVVIGEFGAMEKNGNLQDRVDWASWYVASARARGISCCWWDNNIFQGEGERFGLFDRTGGACVNPEILAAIMKYCE